MNSMVGYWAVNDTGLSTAQFNLAMMVSWMNEWRMQWMWGRSLTCALEQHLPGEHCTEILCTISRTWPHLIMPLKVSNFEASQALPHQPWRHADKLRQVGYFHVMLPCGLWQQLYASCRFNWQNSMVTIIATSLWQQFSLSTAANFQPWALWWRGSSPSRAFVRNHSGRSRSANISI